MLLTGSVNLSVHACKPAPTVDDAAYNYRLTIVSAVDIVYSRTARVVSIVPWVRTPWVVGQLWRAPTASVGGQ